MTSEGGDAVKQTKHTFQAWAGLNQKREGMPRKQEKGREDVAREGAR